MGIPAKVVKRISEHYPGLKRAIQSAASRDVNEADTVSIIFDILTHIFGYDRYLEITREYNVRGTYCDLAIKVDDKPKFLIEVKAVNVKLNDNHIRQAVGYGANHGISWVVLTNGKEWSIYNVTVHGIVDTKLVVSFDFTELNLKKQEDLDTLFLLCKEGLAKDAIEHLNEFKRVVNKFYIGAIIQSDTVINVIRKELNKSAKGLHVDNEDIDAILKNYVIKREIIEAEETKIADKKYRRAVRK